jgi:acetamidase/formamidase
VKHTFDPVEFHTTIGHHEPVLAVADGDTIETWTIDAGGRDRSGEKVHPGGNPQTGPFHVEGAKPGDTLEVTFDRLWPNRTVGFSNGLVAPGPLDPDLAARMPYGEEHFDLWDLDLERGTARIKDPPEGLESMPALPFEPMLGCFGVAPEGGQAISTATSGRHGGNMDYRGFREGVTVQLPVSAEGALLHVGDGHARQGDGEVVGTGIEVSFDVTVTVRVVSGRSIGWPRIDGETHVCAVGNARPLDQAVQHATTELLRMLQDTYGLSYRAGSALLGQCLEYEIGNVFDPAYTVVAKVRRELLP